MIQPTRTRPATVDERRAWLLEAAARAMRLDERARAINYLTWVGFSHQEATRLAWVWWGVRRGLWGEGITQ